MSMRRLILPWTSRRRSPSTRRGERVDGVAKLLFVFFHEIFHPDIRAHAGPGQALLRRGGADSTIDILQGNLNALLARQINSSDTSHSRRENFLSYPCTCLCLGLTSQIIRTLPWRRITLHFSQIFFTEGLTFTIRISLISIGYSAVR